MTVVDMDPADNRPTPPHPFWTFSEGRSVFELGALFATLPALSLLRGGDGHPVLVFPGLLATDASTRPLRSVLRSLGYAPYGWGLGRNMNFSDALEKAMLGLLDKTYADHARKVSIVGWSLGGTFAREIAKAEPQKVRCVITMGSPISPDRRNMSWLTRSVSDQVTGPAADIHAARMAQINTPPPVPTTAIFSRTDGVVGWRGAVQFEHRENNETENIQIPASHSGFGFNPLAIYVLADRLRQREREWRPFDIKGARRLFYRGVSPSERT
jgi:pimeloyl-ACP methyl ester carboxylesterase